MSPNIDLPKHTKEQIKRDGERISDKLSEEQIRALSQFWENEVELVTNTEVTNLPKDTDEEKIRAASTDYKQTEFQEEVTAEIVIKVSTGGSIVAFTYDAFTYTHTIDWEYIPVEEVNNPTANCMGNGGWFNYVN